MKLKLLKKASFFLFIIVIYFSFLGIATIATAENIEPEIVKQNIEKGKIVIEREQPFFIKSKKKPIKNQVELLKKVKEDLEYNTDNKSKVLTLEEKKKLEEKRKKEEAERKRKEEEKKLIEKRKKEKEMKQQQKKNNQNQHPPEQLKKENHNGFVYIEKIAMPYEHQKYLYEMSQKRGLSYIEMLAIVYQESSFNSQAVSENNYGYFQINRVNHETLSQTLNTPNNPLDPYVNINWGTYMLADLYKKYGDKEAVLSAYSKGENGYRKTGKNEKYIQKHHESLNFIQSFL